jgi:hypothetical protein
LLYREWIERNIDSLKKKDIKEGREEKKINWTG